nr:ankyrin repeat domain-containing protein [uncultured Brachyspira sp.]
MLDKGADINAKDNDCKTALMLASYNGYLEVAEFLKANGAK